MIYRWMDNFKRWIGTSLAEYSKTTRNAAACSQPSVRETAPNDEEEEEEGWEGVGGGGPYPLGLNTRNESTRRTT